VNDCADACAWARPAAQLIAAASAVEARKPARRRRATR